MSARHACRRPRGPRLDTDRALEPKGVAAPAVAFAFSFSILFREGVEAVLLIAILLGSLDAGRRERTTGGRSAGASLAALSSRPP